MESNTSSCYHQIQWKDVIERSFGKRTYYLLAEDGDGMIRGILPLVHLKSIPFGSLMVSLPYFNYGGLSSDSEETSNQLLNRAIDIAEQINAGHIELRHACSSVKRLAVKTTKVSMRMALPPDADVLWKSFDAKLRSQIRRPAKEGMYAMVGREEGLDGFYRVLSLNMRDLGTPIYSKKFFENILKELPESTWICSVYTHENVPVASGFLIGFKECMEIPWASSLKSYNRYGPNMLLYWSALKFACENGYRVFDFGRSTPDGGTYKFKQQWGANPVQLYWHYWMKRGGSLPELNPQNPRYRMAIKIWQRLPVSLTRLIGPMIVKNLP